MTLPPSVDVSELVGPSNVPAPLHDAPTDEEGRVDWVRLHALVNAIESLVSAGMSVEARPLAAQLQAIVQRARGPRAPVVDLRAERIRRET